MFNGQIECSLLLNIAIPIKEINYFVRISSVDIIQGTVFIYANLRYRSMLIDSCRE